MGRQHLILRRKRKWVFDPCGGPRGAPGAPPTTGPCEWPGRTKAAAVGDAPACCTSKLFQPPASLSSTFPIPEHRRGEHLQCEVLGRWASGASPRPLLPPQGSPDSRPHQAVAEGHIAKPRLRAGWGGWWSTYLRVYGKQITSRDRQFSLQRERTARLIPQTVGQRPPPREQGTSGGGDKATG